ncbi:MAG: hypothetical protein H0X31_08140 [Nostocaceae cyanobacterium]|nr:hypothetical protein [Nostocaceae cyanobacterium]
MHNFLPEKRSLLRRSLVTGQSSPMSAYIHGNGFLGISMAKSLKPF